MNASRFSGLRIDPEASGREQRAALVALACHLGRTTLPSPRYFEPIDRLAFSRSVEERRNAASFLKTCGDSKLRFAWSKLIPLLCDHDDDVKASAIVATALQMILSQESNAIDPMAVTIWVIVRGIYHSSPPAKVQEALAVFSRKILASKVGGPPMSFEAKRWNDEFRNSERVKLRRLADVSFWIR